ncbi:HNH endonuclease [Paenibacillus bovis]|uniref:HNH endonuclease n=1 Tax=Paenibacillus bovis TaxID=1616788 RepID=A0A172ZIV2_9BACL|nr:HNH endonuclease [Paenibacillus bovis]ANF97518.1 hypothetical protein AR543_16890 [Paenibacillus bovis]
MKLEIELIPESTMTINLRQQMSSYRWRQLSRQIQQQDQYTCQICRRTKGLEIDKLHCHEVWDFDKENGIQRLIGLQSLCFQCHMIKHIGFAEMNGWIEKYQLVEHFCRVNRVTAADYAVHFHEAVQLWIARNRIDWIVELGEYADYENCTRESE